MTSETAKKQLTNMMKSFTQGSILHLLGEVFEQMAKDAEQDGDERRTEQYRIVGATMFVVGLGVDAGCPR